MLINFRVALIKDGITRIVNRLEDDDHPKSPVLQEAYRDYASSFNSTALTDAAGNRQRPSFTSCAFGEKTVG